MSRTVSRSSPTSWRRGSTPTGTGEKICAICASLMKMNENYRIRGCPWWPASALFWPPPCQFWGLAPRRRCVSGLSSWAVAPRRARRERRWKRTKWAFPGHVQPTISTSKNSSGACARRAPSRQASRILLLNWRASSSLALRIKSRRALAARAREWRKSKRGFGPVDRGWGAEAGDRRSGRTCSRGLGSRSRARRDYEFDAPRSYDPQDTGGACQSRERGGGN